MSKFEEQLKLLENKIKATYEEGVTIDEAEKLAAEFLHAQMVVSGELRKVDLDARMRKSGVKAIRASAYLEVVSQAEKKPTETQIASIIDTDKIVLQEQQSLDEAEVSRNELERYYDIFANAHIFYRGVARGNNG
jgi:hypothetical protein